MEKRKISSPITVGLAAVNILIYLGMSIYYPNLLTEWCVIPAAVLQGGEYYRLVTAAFLHFSANHLMNNMLMLVVLGIRLEAILGRWRFVILYMVSAIGANLASVYWYLWTGPNVYSAGASGATMGLAGALLAVIVKRRRSAGGVDKRGMLICIAMCILGGFDAGNVNNAGHIVGMLLGFLTGWILG